MIPPAIIRRLCNPKLEASAFTPTKFDTSDDKAWFGNALLSFLAKDCPPSAFSNRFYCRLSNCFGHIAHYNKHQFYQDFFLDDSSKIEFLRQTLQWPFFGDPNFTYSDVERAVSARIKHSGLLEIYEARFKTQAEIEERAQFARLKAKFHPTPDNKPQSNPATDAAPPPLKQGELFDLAP
ncbi:hypothetical protein RZS28_18500 (plasmid) [Methylocapsa polymorpha]|uniref:Uncharacterized protein n=1 Tax=Methylocapsa polymorpha TaxID=3080828 RepID=A0ABZ0HWR8_9HYPH|nr:hypothetical protein [Methylocapsa sp. RX1]WOJ91719.1 hypothetical protein RZS28_18500 [Methylocapsa sp. RX1]